MHSGIAPNHNRPIELLHVVTRATVQELEGAPALRLLRGVLPQTTYPFEDLL